ncbi:MAG: hypothetical protein J5I41_03240 [Saprospiraceae bacterium]|nr:hypothetical protein [Saprospiraceae bacterium]
MWKDIYRRLLFGLYQGVNAVVWHLLPLAALVSSRLKSFLTERRSVVISACPPGRYSLWMHCASLGEFEQGRPVLEAIRRERPDAWITLTFFSPSGYRIRKDFPHADAIGYLPPDQGRAVGRFLDRVRPAYVLWTKYDFWFTCWRELQARGIPIHLYAARFREDQWIFRAWAFPFLEILLKARRMDVQDEQSARLLRNKGGKHVFVSGDPRVDRVLALSAEPLDDPWLEAFVRGRRVMVAGSVWDKDVECLAAAIRDRVLPDWVWIIVPHDPEPERLDRYDRMLGENAVRYSRRGMPAEGEGAILLLDVVGMLNRVYRLADLAYVGGGFGRSVHNLLEPAVYGLPVLFGPAHDKFPEAEALIGAGGGFCVDGPALLSQRLAWLRDPESRQWAGRAARGTVLARSGATARILAALPHP